MNSTKKWYVGAVIILFMIWMIVRWPTFYPITPNESVIVYRINSSMPEPIQLSKEDAKRIVEIISFNYFFHRFGTSDSIAEFTITIGDQTFNCNAHFDDLNDNTHDLNIRIIYGQKDLKNILLKYTEGYMK